MGATLYVTPDAGGGPAGGRQLLSRLVQDCLADLLGDDLHHLALRPRQSAVGPRAGMFTGQVDGVHSESTRDVLDCLARRRIGTVFLDGSNLGALAQSVKRAMPAVRVVVFFHNVEARFFWGAFRKRKSPKAAAVLLANYLAERKAVRYTDIRVALSERDSSVLRRVYGQGATHVSPIAVADRLPKRADQSVMTRQGYLLFVGGAFYANREGIAWYARHVAPRVALRTVVVGYGMEDMRLELEATGNIDVIGPVESLAPWYGGAVAAVAPIFDGSGMKTKVAEALMFGKRVIGTDEAFSGYDDIDGRAGRVCRTADDFVTAAALEARSQIPVFDSNLRRDFEATYSREALRRRLAGILGVAARTELAYSA